MSRPVVRPVVRPRVVPSIASVSSTNKSAVPVKTHVQPPPQLDPQSYDSYDSDDFGHDTTGSSTSPLPNNASNAPTTGVGSVISSAATTATPVPVPKITPIRVPGVKIAPRNDAKVSFQIGKRDDSFLDQLALKRPRSSRRKSLRDYLWNDGDGTPSAMLSERAQMVLSRRREASRSGVSAGQPTSEASLSSPSDLKDSSLDDGFNAADTGAAKLRIVDGKVVVEAESLIQTFDVTTQGLTEMSEIDEDVGDSAFITSSSFSRRKRVRAHNWGVEDTRKFYEALRVCGTDFGLIASLFPDRTRGDIKSKFNREEKMNPKLVEAALRSSAPMDVQTVLNAVEVANEKLRADDSDSDDRVEHEA